MVGASWGDEFSGRKILITGACGTLGRWLSRACADAGARLGLADVNAAALTEMDRDLGIVRTGGLTHVTDVTDDRSLASLVEAVTTAWGAPDVLINNAGVYPSSYLLETSARLWDTIFDINLRAAFLLTRDIAKAMIAQKVAGSVVNVSSGGGDGVRPGLIPYLTSKGALDLLTKGFAVELGRHGIRVNSIQPGFMPGPAVARSAIERHSRINPLGRHSGAGDAPEAILFLCSSKASFITGSKVYTDGGFVLTAAAWDPESNANNAAYANLAAQ